MRPDSDGLPILARRRWALGVRTEGDTRDFEVVDGMVGPLSGLTIALDWGAIEKSMLPPAFGGTSKKEVMFRIEESKLPPGIGPRIDEPPPGHFVLEPKRRMPIEEYEDLLERTRSDWEQVPKP